MDGICKEALNHYGADSQMLMCIEEMSELTKALCKQHRGQEMRMSIAEEIADVQITLRQMIILFDIEDNVEFFQKFKLDRLKSRMDGKNK